MGSGEELSLKFKCCQLEWCLWINAELIVKCFFDCGYELSFRLFKSKGCRLNQLCNGSNRYFEALVTNDS